MPERAHGVLSGGLDQRAVDLVYGADADAAIDAELALMLSIDRAHLVMLHRVGLLPEPTVAVLLDGIEAIAADDFRCLRGRPAPRGLYFLYEDELRRRVGEDIGGRLHTARSRNDLKTTVLLLRLRATGLELADVLTGLLDALLAAADRHRDTMMPAYTQFQAALPSTYGHYLLGVARALSRHLDDLVGLLGGLVECPMGAGGIAGTELPIDPALMAQLLGFDRPAPVSVDAIAARDRVLHALAGQANTAITISRLAADLQLWTTAEYGLLDLPDRLVGTSSLMPQKRNPYLLEHIKADAAHCASAWMDSAMCIAKVPFTNSVEAGNESTGPVWSSAAALRRSAGLMTLLVQAAEPDRAAMRQQSAGSWIAATAITNALVRADVALRTAHEVVGGAVRIASATGAQPSAEAILAAMPAELAAAARAAGLGFDPEAIVARSEFGGGPGPESFARGLAATVRRRDEARASVAAIRAGVTAAADELAKATGGLVASAGGLRGGA